MLELQTPSAQRFRNPMNFDTLSTSANSNGKLSPWLPRFTRNLHLIKIIQVLASTQDILRCIFFFDSIFLLIGWQYIMLCLWQESKVHAEDQDGRICARTLQTFKDVQRFQRAAQRAFPCCSSANGDSRKINELNKRTVTKCERRICENKHITLLIFVAWQGHCVVVSYGNRCTCHSVPQANESSFAVLLSCKRTAALYRAVLSLVLLVHHLPEVDSWNIQDFVNHHFKSLESEIAATNACKSPVDFALQLPQLESNHWAASRCTDVRWASWASSETPILKWVLEIFESDS